MARKLALTAVGMPKALRRRFGSRSPLATSAQRGTAGHGQRVQISLASMPSRARAHGDRSCPRRHWDPAQVPPGLNAYGRVDTSGAQGAITIPGRGQWCTPQSAIDTTIDVQARQSRVEAHWLMSSTHLDDLAAQSKVSTSRTSLAKAIQNNPV